MGPCHLVEEMEAVFFDLDDTLVLTHAADTIAHRAVQFSVAMNGMGCRRALPFAISLQCLLDDQCKSGAGDGFQEEHTLNLKRFQTI
ncbi:unnamed protein product [Sphagnum jensenii]|uniref:Uncharacterized protein n=1 Tax=Sphagnum jensenii TaxID=128206 RepID=A0ABP0XFN8_9BRYO